MTFEDLDRALAEQATAMERWRQRQDQASRDWQQRQDDWQPVAERLQRIFDQPTHAELDRRRYGPQGRNRG